MSSRKPAKPTPLPTAAEESRRTNILLEAIQKEIRIIHESVNSLTKKFEEVESIKVAVNEMATDIAVIKPMVKTLATDMETVKTELGCIRSDLAALDKRLTTAEARFPA